MTPLSLAKRYMEIFFSGRELERLHEILDDELIFEGPFHRFDSAREYVQSLVADPPTDCSYDVVAEFEAGRAAALIYEFRKPQIDTMMSQLFETDGKNITRILLIFDTSDFGGR